MIREPSQVETRHQELLARLPDEPPAFENQELRNLADDLCRTFGIQKPLLLRFAAAMGEIAREALKEAAQHCL